MAQGCDRGDRDQRCGRGEQDNAGLHHHHQDHGHGAQHHRLGLFPAPPGCDTILLLQARSVVRDLDPVNDLSFLRMRSNKTEILISPGNTASTILFASFDSFLTQMTTTSWLCCKLPRPSEKLSLTPDSTQTTCPPPAARITNSLSLIRVLCSRLPFLLGSRNSRDGKCGCCSAVGPPG